MAKTCHLLTKTGSGSGEFVHKMNSSNFAEHPIASSNTVMFCSSKIKWQKILISFPPIAIQE